MRTIRNMAMLGACGALLAATAVHAQAADERGFATEMIAQIQQRVPGVEVTRQDDPLSISVKGGVWKEREGGTLNFHRIYAYCRNATPADCKATRDEFLDKIVRFAIPPKISQASLRLAVRDREYVDYARKVDATRPMVVAEPIGDDLFAILVSDSADTLALVTPDKLAELGMTRAQAWALAWKQTQAALPALPDGAALAKGAVAYQDQEFLASLLIDTKAWQRIADKVGPTMFATVVADGFVFVGLMPDGANLEEFKQTVREDCASQPRCVSPNLYRFRDGHWVVSRQRRLTRD